MDIAFKHFCEFISISGPHGISWDQFKKEIQNHFNLNEPQLIWPPQNALTYILNIYSQLNPDFSIGKYKTTEHFKKDSRTKLMFFTDLQQLDLDQILKLNDPSSLRFYCSNPTLRHSNLFQGRPIQLSESSLQLLEMVASFGRNGLTQAELAKMLACDSKNVFHWLKSLIHYDLISRTPVASKKSFTYLLTLTKYLDEELSQTRIKNNSDTHTVVSSKEIRQSIIDILAKAPNQTMVSKDVFEQTGLDRLLIKNFRRAATKLNEIGWLEYLFEDQLAGPYCRLFALKRKPAEGLDLKSFLAFQEESKKSELNETSSLNTPRGADYHPDMPIISQIISLLTQSYPDPLTTSELSHRLSIPRKYLYKLIDRIIPLSNKKNAVLGAEGVGKVLDFVGKEKRLKLFIKSDEWRDYYINLFTENSTNTFTSQQANLRPSAPSVAISDPTSSQQSSPSDTRTRQLRHQALLQELSKYQILEIGKDLCQRIQNLLGDNRFTLDLKTLRRSIEILEREHQLKVIVASLPTGTRSLLISPDLSASDEIVQNYITKLSESARNVPLSASTLKLEKLKEAMLHPDYFVDGSLPFNVPQNPSVNSRALTNFGFIFGILARARLFHEFLLNYCDGSFFGFETIPTIFELIPLSLYFKLIGVVRMSRNLHNSIETHATMALKDLPEIFREELNLNRKRFQSQVSTLLNILEELKLIQGEAQFASLNFKLPFKYNFALEVPVSNSDGKIVKLLKFNRKDFKASFAQFWDELQKLCHEFNTKNASIYSEDDFDDTERVNKVSKVLLLARHSDSWRDKPSREKDLEKIVRKLTIDKFNSEKSKRRQSSSQMIDFTLKLETISNNFDVPLDRIKTMISNYYSLLEEREESKRLAKRSRSVLENDNDVNEDLESSESDTEPGMTTSIERWTQSDWSKLSLAFSILQQPFFLLNNPQNTSPTTSTTASTSIKWNLASKIFDKPKSPIIIRRHGLKLFKSYQELARIVEMDSIVRLCMKSFDFKAATDDNLPTMFKSVFDICLNEVNQSQMILDNFLIQSADSTVVLHNRQDHYLNTIDSWIQSRSFRHGLLQNQPGLCKDDLGNHLPVNQKLHSPNCLLLRQMLVYCHSSDQFDFNSITTLIKSSPDLSDSIDYLVSIGFASKNKARDHRRVFNFPLVISETVRDILTRKQPPPLPTELLIGNKTESLNMKTIESIIESLSGSAESAHVQISIQNITLVDKFDAPIKLINNLSVDSVDHSIPTSFFKNPKALWTCPVNQTISAEILQGSLNHLRNSIRLQPGISINDLKRKYENVFCNFEMDLLIQFLVESKLVDLICNLYLQ